MRVATLVVMLPGVLDFPLNVTVSRGMVSNVNFTEQDRACWQDSDCVSYPSCKRYPSKCRCLETGICLLLRGYGEHCTSDVHCGHAMICSDVGGQTGGAKKSVCRCEPEAKYTRFLKQCLRPNPSIRRDMPRFADLPDPGGEDDDVPEEIPPTYGGAMLIGLLSLGLVLLCVILSIWYHHTSRRFRRQMESHECLYTERRRPENEKIPLNLCLPPPEMYQTPGFQNYSTIDNDVVATTSQANVSLEIMNENESRALK